MEYLITALTIGLVGSLHCIGMCGPIAVALPPEGESKAKFYSGRLLYNIGRVVTYAFMGAFFGMLGIGAHLAGWQQEISIILGALIIIIVLLPQSVNNWFAKLPVISKATEKLKSAFSVYLKKDSVGAMFIIGIINGFLPCGLVYVAIAGAIASGGIIEGVLFMTAFGIGTIPAMFVVSIVTSLFGKTARVKIRKLMPLFAVIIGVLFILRGLSLGIPYISPPEKKLEVKEKTQTEQPMHNMH